MSQLSPIAARLKKQLAYLAVLAKAIGTAYEKTGSPADRVRLSEVCELVAAQRDVPVGYPFRRDVVKAARLLGFTRIVVFGHVRHYSGVRKRNG